MKNYKIVFGSGLVYPHEFLIAAEGFECEQDAIDILINQLESKGYHGLFLTQEDIDSGAYGEDEYITGGNHGLYLHHNGSLIIEEVAS